jgi:hypothetical protein
MNYPEIKSSFEYPSLETAALVRSIVSSINKRVKEALLACYQNGQDLCEIRSFLGYGGFTRWLSSSEWEYSPRMAYRFITIYKRSQKLGLLPEWFGDQLLISSTDLGYILAPSKESAALKIVEILKAGEKVNKEVFQQIKSGLPYRITSCTIVNNYPSKFHQNLTTYNWNGLRFRSKAEVEIAAVLEQQSELAFWPNCRGRLNTPEGRRNLEPDFLICYSGRLGILEVDGPFHTPERRVEEQERERLFRNYGIRVIERFDYKRCMIEPEQVVEEFLQIMQKMYEM